MKAIIFFGNDEKVTSSVPTLTCLEIIFFWLVIYLVVTDYDSYFFTRTDVQYVDSKLTNRVIESVIN